MALEIWCLGDGRRGHENQIRGLLTGLQQLAECSNSWFGPQDSKSLQNRIRDFKNGLAGPELIIGAGRKSHWSILKCGYQTGAKTLVLMNPGLLRHLFDVAIIPQHDGIEAGKRCIVSQGALNSIEVSTPQENSGMVLLGGPSKHFVWDNEAISRQICRIISDDQAINWQIVASPRTPPELLTTLAEQAIQVLAPEDQPSGWLAREMSRQATIWVSPDSVSMLSEARSTRAKVGVFELATSRPGRVSGNLNAWMARGWVQSFSEYLKQGALSGSVEPLMESSRCAREALEKLGLLKEALGP